MALILMPFANLPEWTGLPVLVGALAWFWLKVGMTLLALAWTFRLVEAPLTLPSPPSDGGEGRVRGPAPGRPFPVAAKVLTVLLALRPIAGDLSHGNVNL